MQNRKSTFPQKNYCFYLQDYYCSMTQPSTPQDFRFMSANFCEQDKYGSIKWKAEQQTQQNSFKNCSQKYDSYKSFTDLMEYDIKALIEAQQKQEAKEEKRYKNFLNRYQSSINKYFQKMFGVNFSQNSLKNIFGQGELSFGQTQTEKILKINDYCSIEQKRMLIQKIKAHQKLQKFLIILTKNLCNQISFEYFLMSYQMLIILQQNSEFDLQQVAQNYFYDFRIKYINFRCAKIDTLNDSVKNAFQDFISFFLELIIQIDQEDDSKYQQRRLDDQKNEIGLRRFGLYSSKNDLFESGDESQCFANAFLPRKKIHLNDQG